MLLKELSPVSILVGVLFALASVALLWPVDRYGTAILVLAFCIGAGAWELFRRMSPRKHAGRASRRRTKRR